MTAPFDPHEHPHRHPDERQLPSLEDRAVADPEHALAEGKDNNNELKVSARCTDAS